MKLLRHILFPAALLVPTSLWAAVALIVIPPAAFDTEGASSTNLPFSTDTDICQFGERFQHVYAGSDIGSASIDGMAFRQDGDLGGPASFNVANVIVTLSHTDVPAGTVGGTFAENMQAGGTVVFAGNLEIDSLPVKGGDGPFPFDVVIPFDSSFQFDSSNNLLVDIQIPSGSCDGDLFLDATPDGLMAFQASNDLAAPFAATTMPAFGIVTQFIISTPPPVFNPGGFSGSWWFGPTHDGEGLLIEVVDIGGTPFIVVYWFTYNAAGDQMWLVGIAEFTGFGPTVIAMEQLTGPVFGPAFDPDDVTRVAWGTLTIEFFDEDTGEASWASVVGFGAGSYDMFRLTSIFGNPPVFGVAKDAGQRSD